MFAPGHNCWVVEEASRFGMLVDGVAFFTAAKQLLESARRSVFVVGWDLHSQTVLEPQHGPRAPTLSEVMQACIDRRPELEIFILGWDPSPIYALERELWPRIRGTWGGSRRIHFEQASDHPLGASHHQKILVVDDSVACVGGLDLTISRWDTRAHAPVDARRRLPNGRSYGPFHDVQAIVEGPAAERLGQLARERWHRAGGTQPLPPVQRSASIWPAGVESFGRTSVAIARTQGAWDADPGVREIEQLHVDAIASAQKFIFIENQFVSSRRLAEALGEVLRREDGPEVVIVTSDHDLGTFERGPLLALRARFMSHLRDNDVHGRLGAYAPQAATGCPIKVHSKVAIVDGRILVLGSANLSTRSMCLDTECDLAIDGNTPQQRRFVRGAMGDLLSEHLGCSLSQWNEAFDAANGRPLAAIERLRGEGRTLLPLVISEQTPPVRALDHVADAEHALDRELLRCSIPDDRLRRRAHVRLPRVVVSVAAVLALLVLWTSTPLAAWCDPARLAAWGAEIATVPGGPWVAVLVFCAAALSMVPVTVLIIATALVFDAKIAFAISMLGSMSATVMGYATGRYFWSSAVIKVVGARLRRVTERLATAGVISVTFVRMLPIAPFAVVNLVAGSVRVPLRSLLWGTLLGMGPGIVALTLATDRVVLAAMDPSLASIAIAVVILLLLGVAAFGVQRLLRRGEVHE